MLCKLAIGFLSLSACLSWGAAARGALISDFADFSLRTGSTTVLPGRLYIPPTAVSDPSTPRPLILFLHGAGESGTNNSAQVNGNIDNLLAEAKRRDAYLFAPQTNGGWSSTTITGRVMTMVERALAEHNVDPRRLYVTGLSMGGGGTWNMLNRYGDQFAAGVPICAVTPGGDFVPARFIDEPAWAFHARNDGTVNVATTRNVVNRVLAAAGQSAPVYPTTQDVSEPEFSFPGVALKYTDYRAGGHGIWGRVYNTPAVYEWMFSHTTVPEPAALGGGAIGLAALWSRVRRQRRAAAA